MPRPSPQSDHPFSVPGLNSPSDSAHPAPEQGLDQHSDSDAIASSSPLLGRLPCIRCRYELQGLSVASRCPECGLPIGVTILAVVDPFAKELQPIAAPRLIVCGTLLWAGGATVIAALVWLVRLAELSITTWGTTYWPGWAPLAIVIITLLAGLGAIAFVRPHAKLPHRQQLAALIAVLLHLPLAYAHWVLYHRIDMQRPAADYFAMDVNPERVTVRIICGLLSALIVLCIRPNARALVARSMVLRTGRVDRQTLYALAAAFGIGVVGDLLRLSSAMLSPVAGEIVSSTGLMLVVLGAALATIGIVGVIVDTWRMRRTILSAPITMADVVAQQTVEERPA